jgi:Zn-finger nucleic acid-binding protein
MNLPGSTCPRCNGPLGAAELGGVAVLSCATCHGALLTQLLLPQVLEGLSVELLKTFDPDATVRPLADRNPRVPCPNCRRVMEHDNYCGADLVFFDRCEPCGLLWLDADELGTMSLMWARMERRHERDHEQGEKLLAEVGTFVDRVLIARAIANLMR